MKHFIRLLMAAFITLAGQFFIQPSTTQARPTPTLYTYRSDPNVAIPDYSGAPRSVTDSISIFDPLYMDSLSLYVRADHNNVGDLVITLTHNGTSVVVMDRPGYPASSRGCRNGHLDVSFIDSASLEVETMCYSSGYAIQGDVRPHNPLSAFNGRYAEGEWQLTIADHRSGISGTLIAWELRFDGTLIIPEVRPAGIGSYGCHSGGLTVNYVISNVPTGTYRHIAGAWVIDLNPGGMQDGGHIMWREWTAAVSDGTTPISLVISETFDPTATGLTVYRVNWGAAFGGAIPANRHMRVFYQVWSADMLTMVASGVVTVPNCAG